MNGIVDVMLEVVIWMSLGFLFAAVLYITCRPCRRYMESMIE